MKTIIYLLLSLLGLPIVVISTFYHLFKRAWYKGEINAIDLRDWLNA